MSSFVALDFETADDGPDSACAIGLVRVDQGQITARAYSLLRPPRSHFLYTHIHGITWEQVSTAPLFSEVWPKIAPMILGVDFLAAHYAKFDRRVLYAHCRSADLSIPPQKFVCTLRLSRATFPLTSFRLPSVCSYLGIPLQHHHALSDAEACARILMTIENREAI